MLSRRHRIALEVQRIIAIVFMFPTYCLLWAWFRLVLGYRIPELKSTRQRFKQLVREVGEPFLICANHMTLFDSCFIIWALASPWDCLLHPLHFPWNLPERQNFYKSIGIRSLCYLGKCIPIVRRGPPEETALTLEKVSYMLHRKQSFIIFPEGGRSRQGHLDTENFSYGVGRILQEVAEAKVLCVYLRGSRQVAYSDLPCRHEEFYVDIRLSNPSSQSQGLRGSRDIATQIIHELADMEKGYDEYLRRK